MQRLFEETALEDLGEGQSWTGNGQRFEPVLVVLAEYGVSQRKGFIQGLSEALIQSRVCRSNERSERDHLG